MADKFTRFLTGVGQGFTNPKGNMGDARHAARMFNDGAFARAPRSKFLFHVYFELNDAAMRSKNFKNKHKKEIGLLVKNATLPRFTFDTEVLNQYNKKKVIYKNISYEPIQIKFHDDNTGIVNALWALYYGYYSPERANDKLAWNTVSMGPYRRSVEEFNKFRYGLDQDGVEEPFIKSITIYTMAKRRFNSYTLVNPHIQNWDHGDVDYSQSSGLMESTMQLAYESVIYGSGEIQKGNNPINFGELHYDTVPSPLSVLGGGTASLFGPGGILAPDGAGVLAGAKEIFGDNYSDAGRGDINFLQAAVGAINLYKSFSSITKDTLTQEVLNLALVPGRATNTISGLAGISFPAVSTSDTTPASEN